jgi:two-component system response regulator DesR
MIRVLLADDENLIRGALGALLSHEEDLAIVAEASTGPEAVAMAVRHTPDVAVLDLQMPARTESRSFRNSPASFRAAGLNRPGFDTQVLAQSAVRLAA